MGERQIRADCLITYTSIWVNSTSGLAFRTCQIAPLVLIELGLQSQLTNLSSI